MKKNYYYKNPLKKLIVILTERIIMKDSIDLEKLKEKTNDIDHLQENTISSLNEMNYIINDFVNTGKGIWDGEDAFAYKEEWNKKIEKLPSFIQNMFQEQKEIIKKVISSLEKANLQ